MNTKIIYSTLFSLLIISCTEKKQREANDIVSLKKTCKQLENELFIIKENEIINQEIFQRNIKYSDMSIDNTLVYWGRDSSNCISLSQIASKPHLIFCFSINTCSPCVDNAIGMIKEVFADFDKNERVIIAGDHPLRLRENHYGKKKLTGIQLPIEEIEAPFFFVLDENLKLSLLHIFNKANPNLTAIYLKEIAKRCDI